ncbi:MAG: tRNA 2-thiouridine(34) synthase MnmA [Kiritimatiellales bacterium]
MKKRAAVGMSGGTDSSVAAALLVEQGYEVIGLTAHMWKEGSRCCSLEDVTRAQKVCASLGIRHYVVNAQDRFAERVVNPFVDGYAAGRTPSPCISCNQFIKFGFLLTRAVQLNCDVLATGHYAKNEQRDGSWHLGRAVDRTKDQTYFLHRLSQKQLAHIIFPLGNWVKEDVKKWSNDHSLPIVPRGESQDLCFVEAGRYAEFIEARVPDVKKKGKLRDDQGNELGEHEGVHRFTVGQRGGTGVAVGQRIYVSNIDRESNEVTLAPRDKVMHSRCFVEDVHWISGDFPTLGKTYTVQPRYGHRGAAARIEQTAEDAFTVIFDEPQFALAPGQAAVVYDGDEVLGGGWIVGSL